MLLYHHTKICASEDIIGKNTRLLSWAVTDMLVVTKLDGKPLFNVPKSIALDSIKDWKNGMDINFPVRYSTLQTSELLSE